MSMDHCYGKLGIAKIIKLLYYLYTVHKSNPNPNLVTAVLTSSQLRETLIDIRHFNIFLLTAWVEIPALDAPISNQASYSERFVRVL